MAQTTDYEIANSSGLIFRGRVNEVLAAVQSNNSGATTPTGTVAYQLWYDTTTNTLKMRNGANSDWIILLDNSGGAVVATQAEAEAGSNNTKLMTPLSVSQAIDAQNINLSALTTLSGSNVDFTGIPSTARRVTVMGNVLSTNGTSSPLIQLGDAGGIETSGYAGAIGFIGAGSSNALSAGVTLITTMAATITLNFTVTFNLIDAATNLWSFSGMMSRTDAAVLYFVSGNKSLSETLTQVRLTTNSANTFDAGTASVSWE
jgi:hypothetical protein